MEFPHIPRRIPPLAIEIAVRVAAVLLILGAFVALGLAAYEVGFNVGAGTL